MNLKRKYTCPVCSKGIELEFDLLENRKIRCQKCRIEFKIAEVSASEWNSLTDLVKEQNYSQKRTTVGRISQILNLFQGTLLAAIFGICCYYIYILKNLVDTNAFDTFTLGLGLVSFFLAWFVSGRLTAIRESATEMVDRVNMGHLQWAEVTGHSFKCAVVGIVTYFFTAPLFVLLIAFSWDLLVAFGTGATQLAMVAGRTTHHGRLSHKIDSFQGRDRLQEVQDGAVEFHAGAEIYFNALRVYFPWEIPGFVALMAAAVIFGVAFNAVHYRPGIGLVRNVGD